MPINKGSLNAEDVPFSLPTVEEFEARGYVEVPASDLPGIEEWEPGQEVEVAVIAVVERTTDDEEGKRASLKIKRFMPVSREESLDQMEQRINNE